MLSVCWLAVTVTAVTFKHYYILTEGINPPGGITTSRCPCNSNLAVLCHNYRGGGEGFINMGSFPSTLCWKHSSGWADGSCISFGRSWDWRVKKEYHWHLPPHNTTLHGHWWFCDFKWLWDATSYLFWVGGGGREFVAGLELWWHGARDPERRVGLRGDCMADSCK